MDNVVVGMCIIDEWIANLVLVGETRVWFAGCCILLNQAVEHMVSSVRNRGHYVLDWLERQLIARAATITIHVFEDRASTRCFSA